MLLSQRLICLIIFVMTMSMAANSQKTKAAGDSLPEPVSILFYDKTGKKLDRDPVITSDSPS